MFKNSYTTVIFTLVASPLFSMELQEIETVQNSTITVDLPTRNTAPQWKYECCPDAYSNKHCCEARGITAMTGGITAGVVFVFKGIDYMLEAWIPPYHRSVGQACHDIWCGGDSCDTAGGCCCVTTRWTMNAIMIAGAVSSLLSVVPCVNHNGCNVWRRTRVVDGQVMTQLQESKSKANKN